MLDEHISQLKAALGTAYNLAYCDYLVFIDPKELLLEAATYIGGGSFGSVYKVGWVKKPEVKFDNVKERLRDVAIKIHLRKDGHTFSARLKFIDELDTTYRALAADAGGCIDFFGFTKVPVDFNGELTSSSDSMQENWEFALVFDFAAEGTLLDFLDDNIRPGKPIANWKIIKDALSGVAGGLKTIHQRNILHRDLHPNNVLVQFKTFTNTKEVFHDVVLSDLGEGKELMTSLKSKGDNVSTLPADIDLGQYQAPEIDEDGFSKMTDIFSWAQLGIDIIRRYYHKLAEDTGTVRYPIKLMHPLEACLDGDPKERYEASLLVFMLNELETSLDEDDLRDEEWTEGDYELHEVAKRLSTSLNLPASWRNST